MVTTFPEENIKGTIHGQGNPLSECLGPGKRKPSGGENVPPAAAFMVERREAPHPYVTGVRVPRQARGGPRHGPLGTYVTGARRLPALCPGTNEALIYQQNFLEFGCRPEPYPYSIGLPY
jgi:hypothetical protein